MDVLWLSPVYKSPNDDNGYDISDYQDIMDDFGKQLENDLLFTIDRIRKLERNKSIVECLEILRFHRDSWDGIEWAIRDIEDLKRKE